MSQLTADDISENFKENVNILTPTDVNRTQKSRVKLAQKRSKPNAARNILKPSKKANTTVSRPEEMASELDSRSAINRVQARRDAAAQSADSEGGTLLEVRLIDFMSHKNFIFPGPNHMGQFTGVKPISFICGKNGSGKSAILQAVKILFCGTARGGKDYLSYIREGADCSAISCIIMNDCANSYQPQTYGKKIKIEISLTKITDKAGKLKAKIAYKVRSAQNKVVATTKAAIVEIARHFSIMIDNPIVVLDQETAKTFLSNFQKNKMYQFFEKTTSLEEQEMQFHRSSVQLQELKNVYKELEKSRKDTKEKLEKWTRLKKDYEESLKGDQQIKLLKIEAVWASIDEYDTKVVPHKKNILKYESEISTYQKQLKDGDVMVENFKKKIEKSTQELAEIEQELETVESELAELNKEIETMKIELNEANKMIKGSLKQVQNTEQNIKEISNSLNRERKRFANDQTEIKIQELNQQIVESETQRKLHEQNLRVLENEHDNLEQAKNTNFAELESKKKEHTLAHKKLANLKREVENLEKDTSILDKIYGQNCQKLKRYLARPDVVKTFQHPPIGPIGDSIKVDSEYKIWTNVIERKVIGQNTLHSWIVSSTQDSNLLREYARLNGFKIRGSVITYKDFSNQKVDQINDPRADRGDASNIGAYFPVDILYINNAVVHNLLLTRSSMNNKALLPQQRESHAVIIKRAHRSCRSLFLPDGQEFFPKRTNKAFDAYNSRAVTLLEDLTELKRQKKLEAQEAEAAYNLIREEYQTMDREYRQLTEDWRKCQNQMKSLENQIKYCWQSTNSNAKDGWGRFVIFHSFCRKSAKN